VATTIANVKKYPGGRDVWGGHGVFIANYTGPTSYQGGAGGGDIIYGIGGVGSPQEEVAANTPLRNIDQVLSQGSVSGTYEVVAFPFTAGPAKQWLLRWFNAIGRTEVANTTNLSAETVILTIIGG
jgi:hypothetical protein